MTLHNSGDCAGALGDVAGNCCDSLDCIGCVCVPSFVRMSSMSICVRVQ